MGYHLVSEILSGFESISHETVRKCYLKIKEVINLPEKKKRRLIAIDETVIKMGNERIYVWVAIDVDTKECLAVWVSKGRSRIEVYTFLKKILQYCENKPEIVVDRAPWYPWALQRLGFKYRNETFGERNAVEYFFSKLKERTKRFWNRFPFNSSLNSILSWLESFVALYNFRINLYNNFYNKTS